MKTRRAGGPLNDPHGFINFLRMARPELIVQHSLALRFGQAQHPDLVPNDLKLCAYLRMNMNSKEMASLLNISLRGVEIRRYRLRKKLNLEHDKNLVEFLMEL